MVGKLTQTRVGNCTRYEDIKKILNNMPLHWRPAILIHIVKLSIRCFIKGKLIDVVRKVIEENE